ncbi:MAG: hypothetical protein ABS81_16995 [Pseudonocardia sp. SCN 72-86]|nr:MAG: hypothetical protein ABS81_16995 [Pseudonocardia sp. SCN 72-86]
MGTCPRGARGHRGLLTGRHGTRRRALVRTVAAAQCDVDLLVEFRPGRTPGLLHLAQMELELEALLGRSVDLRTDEDLSPLFRDQVAAAARPLYAA